MTERKDQVANTLKRAVQEVLSRGLNDPRIRGLISVTSVKVTEDLKDAWIDVSVLPAEHAELSLHGLQHATPHVQSAVAKRVSLRRLPRLRFRLDDSLKKEAAIFSAIAQGVRRTEANAPPDETREP